MLLDKINYESDDGLRQDPQYPEVYRINLMDLAKLHKCPLCGGNFTSREAQPSSRIIHDYDTINNRVIILTISRKNYRCSTCKRSTKADAWLNEITRTEEFDRFIALEVIRESELGLVFNSKTKKTQWNLEAFAKRYGYSGNTISNIAKKYAPTLTPLLVPAFGYNTYLLYPFEYDSQKRYYLIVNKNGTRDLMLAVFGYNNAYEEIKTYFTLHKDFFLRLIKNSVVYTDFDAELIQFLRNFFGEVKIIDTFFEQKLDLYKEQLKYKKINKVTRQYSDYPFGRLSNCVIPNKYDKNQTTFDIWWNEVLTKDNEKGTEFEKYLIFLKEEVNNCKNELCDIVTNGVNFIDQNFRVKNLIDKQLKASTSTRTDFSVVAAKLMLLSNFIHKGGLYLYTSSIFTNPDKISYNVIDEETELQEWNSYDMLIYDTFNTSDIAHMIINYYMEEYPDEYLHQTSLTYDKNEVRELFNDDYIVYDDIEFCDDFDYSNITSDTKEQHEKHNESEPTEGVLELFNNLIDFDNETE